MLFVQYEDTGWCVLLPKLLMIFSQIFKYIFFVFIKNVFFYRAVLKEHSLEIPSHLHCAESSEAICVFKVSPGKNDDDKCNCASIAIL